MTRHCNKYECGERVERRKSKCPIYFRRGKDWIKIDLKVMKS